MLDIQCTSRHKTFVGRHVLAWSDARIKSTFELSRAQIRSNKSRLILWDGSQRLISQISASETVAMICSSNFCFFTCEPLRPVSTSRSTEADLTYLENIWMDHISTNNGRNCIILIFYGIYMYPACSVSCLEYDPDNFQNRWFWVTRQMVKLLDRSFFSTKNRKMLSHRSYQDLLVQQAALKNQAECAFIAKSSFKSVQQGLRTKTRSSCNFSY